MKKYKVSNSELGYEQIIMAENEQDAEIDGLVHCKEYLQEYINIDVEEVVEWQKSKQEKSLIIYEVMMIILMRNGAVMITSNKKNHFMNGALYMMI